MKKILDDYVNKRFEGKSYQFAGVDKAAYLAPFHGLVPGLAKAIGHNLAVYNRLQCARQLNIELKPILPNAEA